MTSPHYNTHCINHKHTIMEQRIDQAMIVLILALVFMVLATIFLLDSVAPGVMLVVIVVDMLLVAGVVLVGTIEV